MTITYVGGVVSGRTGNSNATIDVSLSSGLTGGSNAGVSAGDLVVVTVCTGSAARSPVVAISGYTNLTAQRTTATTYDTNVQTSYKFMGSTPDSVVTIPAQGNVADGQAYSVQVFRGVDPSTPLDVTPTYATGSGANSNPNPAAITPTTAGAWIVVTGGGAAATGANFTAAYLTNFLTANGADTNDGTVGAGYYTAWTSGPYDPAAFGGGSANAANSWGATTIALRPEPVIVYASATYSSANSISNYAVATNNSTFSVGNYAAATFDYSFALRNYASANYAPAFSVLNFAASSYSSAFEVEGLIFANANYSGAFAVSNFVTVSHAASYAVINLATSGYVSAFNVKNYTGGSYAAAFDVLGASQVTASYAAQYAVSNYVLGENSGAYGVSSHAIGSFNAEFALFSFASGSYSGGFEVINISYVLAAFYGASTVANYANSFNTCSFIVGSAVVLSARNSGFSNIKKTIRPPDTHSAIQRTIFAVRSGGTQGARRANAQTSRRRA